MPRVTEEHRRAQRERITSATVRVAQVHGLAGVSMGEVIKESGMSAGAIYGYFKGKDELVAAVAAELVAGRLAAIEQLTAERPVPAPFELVRRLFASMPPEIVQRGLILEVWGAAARDGHISDVAREQLRRFTDSVADYLAVYLHDQGQPVDDAARLGRDLAPVLTAIAQGYLVRVAVDGSDGADVYLGALGALEQILPKGLVL